MNELKVAYETDFYAWLMHNAALLRQGKLAEVDLLNVAEELESMGKSQQNELISRLRVLLAHLLKWQYQPKLRSGSWKATIREQRNKTEDLLENSPSLKSFIQPALAKAYKKALNLAADETGLPQKTFPSTCPYTLEQVLDNNFYP